MRLKRRWRPDKSDAQEILAARDFSAMLHSALVDSVSGRTSEKGNPLRSRTFDGPTTKFLVEHFRVHACRKHLGIGSDRCKYWNARTASERANTCMNCADPLVSWSAFEEILHKGLNEIEPPRQAKKGLTASQLAAWRSDSSFDLVNAKRLLNAAKASGLLVEGQYAEILDLISTQRAVLQDLQKLRRKIKSKRKGGARKSSLLEQLAVNGQALCFTWHQPDDGFEVSYLPASNEPFRVVDKDVMFGMGGHYDPRATAPEDAVDVAAVLGWYPDSAPFIFSVLVTLFPLPIEQAWTDLEELTIAVRVVVRPQRQDGSESLAMAMWGSRG